MKLLKKYRINASGIGLGEDFFKNMLPKARQQKQK
jgi:hypothetical protein